MFLKRIVMQGFKSFADRTVIDFEDPITGIVGPNGCGKSNITDAIRWVLGEQSAKSLRGSMMSDVIFAGSESRKSVNVAEVTLVVDNSSHILPSTYDELEITRRLHRIDNTSEYLINRQPVRLKDIVELTLDTGLGRESLGIITQGNIQQFADAKPEDRRSFFEEAAGVAKYKRRKHESELTLERTKVNLERVFDILSEIEKQVEPLRKQAKKAEAYFEKKEELEKIEVAVLVSEIRALQGKIEEADLRIKEKEAEELIDTAQITQLESDVQNARERARKLDFEISGYQERLIRAGNDVSSLKRMKVEIDEKRKYLIDHADDKERAEQLKARLEETRFDYNDRKERYEKKIAENELIRRKQDQIYGVLTSAKEEYNRYRETLQRHMNRLHVLNAQLESPYQYQQGVQAIVSSKEGLPGILDVVNDAIKPEEGYETAVSTAIAGAMYHIITVDEAAARNAIAFLKRNRSGRATFLPLTVIKGRYIARDMEIIAENTKGYLGIAQDFVTYDPRYEEIASNLLGSVFVTDNLENANELARRIRYQYRVVTLEGDVVNRGGSMTGGTQRDSYSPMTLRSEKKKTEELIGDTRVILSAREKRVADLEAKWNTAGEELIQNRIESAKLEASVQTAKQEYESARNDYQRIAPEDEDTEENVFNELVSRLNEAYSVRDEIQTAIRMKNEARQNLTKDISAAEDRITVLRQKLNELRDNSSGMNTEKVKAETMRENYLVRLNTEYQMTLEHAENLTFELDLTEAKQRVLVLRNEIRALGTINPDAPEQYREINERYTVLKSQYEELVSSKQKLENAIREMDTVMVEKFSDTFRKINKALPEVFVKLFGGGKAKLVLTDEEDLLNAGIDIDIQPPGKNVQNIRLFSGGEKSLIAICVLFTMLKVNPVPLCLFDEIESALDTANVDRFARYLKEYSKETQFIVVTHRTGTMENCDVLYGVTMPKQGVSQMLKVKLSDARRMSEENQETERSA
ncbi:MAG: AAA family ATPase [Erysipelotrichales bacterium]|nr:AAA family ATPase [Erysipelotrichales bacterium]